MFKNTNLKIISMKRFYFIALAGVFAAMCVMGCKKEEAPKATVPVTEISTTLQNAELTFTSVKISGSVTSDGGEAVTARGLCWSTHSNPTIADSKMDALTDAFTLDIDQLLANTTYYFRAFATNAQGTGYGNEFVISTPGLAGTKWDFTLIHSETISWHADVSFNSDGTTVYDEPEYPGAYLTNGTWLLSGNALQYDLDASDDPATDDKKYQFTGMLSGNTMAGTYTFGEENKSWTATLVP